MRLRWLILALLCASAAAQTYSSIQAVTLPGGWQWPNLCSDLNPVGSQCAGGTGVPVSSGLVNTTLTTAVTSTGSQTVHVASSTGIAVNQALLIGTVGGTTPESVVVTGIGSGTFTANFSYTHTTTTPVTCCYISQTNGITTPSLDGKSMKLSFVGPSLPSGQTTNVLAPYKVGANNNAVTYIGVHHVYLPTVSNIEAVELDQFGFHNGHRYMMGSECDSPATSTGYWRIWNQAANSGGGAWVQTTVPCTILTTAATWHQIQWNTHIDPITSTACSGQPCMYYDELTVDTVTYPINLAEPSYPSGDGDNNGIQFQLDIGAAGGTGTIYEDEMSLTLSSTRYVAQTAGTFSGGTACNGQTAITPATWNSTTEYPGDKTYVCGVITSQLSKALTGTSVSPINITFDSGAGIAPVACGFGLGNNECIDLDGSSYVLVDGGTACGPGTSCNAAEEASSGSGTTGYIEATNNGTSTGLGGCCTNQVPSQAISCLSCSHVIVENLIVRNMYIHSSTSDTAIGNDATTCVTISGSNNSVHDSTFHDMGWCLIDSFQSGDASNELYNNAIYNIDHGVVPSGPASSITAGPIWIHNNDIFSFSNWDAGSTYHHDGIHCFSGNASGQNLTLYIYNNTFAGPKGTGFNSYSYIEGSTGPPCMTSSGGHLYYFNNIAFPDTSYSGSPASVWQLSNAASVLMVNNTILGDAQSNGTDLTCTGVGSETWNNNVLTQNAVLASFSGCTNASGSPDYDVYALDSYSGSGFYCGGSVSFSGFKSCVGGAGEAHSSNPSASGVSYTTGLPNSGSAAIGAGVNLYSTCNGQPTPGLGALCYDAAGFSRPLSGAWTAGALNAAVTTAYTLTVTMIGNGTVSNSYNSNTCVNGSGAGCSISVPSGTVVSLTQSPGSGYAFTSWSGACSGSGTCSVTLSANAAVTATFTTIVTTPTLTVTISPSAGGTVTSTPSGISCPGTCSFTFSSGTSITLAEAVNTGYTFAGWSGAAGCSVTCSFVINSNTNITASFGTLPLAAAPVCSPAAGTYLGPQIATCTTTTGTIQCYNFVGSPTVGVGGTTCSVGVKYSAPIPVTASETLYIVAGGPSYTQSTLTKVQYVISTVGNVGNGNTIHAVQPPIPTGTNSAAYAAVLAQRNPLLSGQTIIVGMGNSNASPLYLDGETGSGACAPTFTAGFAILDPIVAAYSSSLLIGQATEGGTNTFTSQCVWSQAQADASNVPYLATSYLPGQYILSGGIYWVVSNNSYASPSLDNTCLSPGTAVFTGAGPITDGPCTWTQSTVSSGAHAPPQDGYCGPSYPCGGCWTSGPGFVININSLGACTLTQLYESQPIPSEPPIAQWTFPIVAAAISHYAGKVGYVRFGSPAGGEYSPIGVNSGLWPNYGSTSTQQRAQYLSWIKILDTSIMSNAPQMTVCSDMNNAGSGGDPTYADQEAQLAHDLNFTCIGTNGYQVNDVVNLLGTGPHPCTFPLVSSATCGSGDWPYNFSRFSTNAAGQTMYHTLQTLTGSTPLVCASGVSPGITGPLAALPSGSTYCSGGFPGLLPFLIQLCQRGVNGGSVKICDSIFEEYVNGPNSNPNSGTGPQAYPAGDTLMALDASYCSTTNAQCGASVTYVPQVNSYQAAMAQFLGLGYQLGVQPPTGLSFTIGVP